MRPSTLVFLTLSSFLPKAMNVIELVSTCQCKGGRLIFLGRPSPWYSSLLDLVFCSSKDYECDTASIYMSLQGWQADVLRQAFGFSSARCASSAAVNVTRPASIYVDRIR